ncbi:putative DNA binding domain-containing protein [Thermodesulfovibrionales bacterium]|nr:putative DNA binding domain-containing protein [Thermodesulfovibrionales bacterium]MCL0087054.1 putative DNA binding domain-containing protein [Thermodesulfovibrionales bacterium]
MKTKGLSELISTSESTTVEWKPSLSQINEIINAISAFANTEGGKIFVGVSKSGKLLGVQIGRNTIENLTNKISQNTDPKVHPCITVEKINSKSVIIIEAKESSDHLVLAFGRPYKRVGKSTVRMSKDEYERLILEKHKDKLQFDTQVCLKATLKDIDKEKLRWFLRKAKEERNYDVDPETPIREALNRLNLIEGGKLNNAAILLFRKDTQKFFPQVKIRAGRFKGTEGLDFIDMKVLEGTIPELREKAMKFILEHIKHGIFFDANRRYDKWEYPLRALEEVLNNALAHREYFSNAEIQLSIYDDRIEVWNPGELPSPLTLEDLRREHKSIPRNKFLADKLFLIKYIEEWGRRTNRIIDEMRENELPEPEFKNYSGGFAVTLYGPGKSFEEKIEKEKLHILEINERQKKAIEYLKTNDIISTKIYIRLNKVSDKTAFLELKDLFIKNILMKEGKGRATIYKLKM